ncbi:hypothetical protein FOL47_010833 [Perkinsus chesapeaki]|uniref:Uncharacterized protein n=1 Tax=Perkinsus chesapeaki TaxID=330153 RepID=A0A7J6MNQ7_PERCH|nr:hypothetical protein FOL47_010833 [Perkinsus chesapeaki]
MVQLSPAPPPPRGEISPTESEREETALPHHEEELLDLRKEVMLSIEKLYESNDAMAEEIRSAPESNLTEARELRRNVEGSGCGGCSTMQGVNRYSYIEENMDVLERKFRKLRAINRKLGLPEEDGGRRCPTVVAVVPCRCCSTLVQRVPDGRLLFTWEGKRDGSKLRKAEILVALSEDKIGGLSNEELKQYVLAAVKGRGDFDRASRLWSTVRDEILRRVTDLHPADLTALLNAVARGGVREADRLCEAAADHARENLVLFTPGYLAQFMSSLANLNTSVRRPAVKAFVEQLQEHLIGGGLSNKWSPRDGAVLVGAIVKLSKSGRGYDDLCKLIGDVILLPEVSRFQPIEFATVAAAFSKLPMSCGRRVMREMARVLPDRFAEFGEQELCNTVQAYARLEMWETAVFTAASYALLKSRRSMTPIGLSSIASTYSKLSMVDARLLDYLLRQALACLDRTGKGRDAFKRQELALFLNSMVQLTIGQRRELSSEGWGILAMLFQRYAGMESSREEYKFNAMVARAVGRCIRAGRLPAEVLEGHLRPPLKSQPTPTLQDYACILNAAFEALEVSESVELGDFTWVTQGVASAILREPENSKQVCICLQGMAVLELGEKALWELMLRSIFPDEGPRHLPVGELATTLRALRKVSRRGDAWRDVAVGYVQYVERCFSGLIDYEVLDLPSAVSIYHSIGGILPEDTNGRSELLKWISARVSQLDARDAALLLSAVCHAPQNSEYVEKLLPLACRKAEELSVSDLFHVIRSCASLSLTGEQRDALLNALKNATLTPKLCTSFLSALERQTVQDLSDFTDVLAQIYTGLNSAAGEKLAHLEELAVLGLRDDALRILHLATGALPPLQRLRYHACARWLAIGEPTIPDWKFIDGFVKQLHQYPPERLARWARGLALDGACPRHVVTVVTRGALGSAAGGRGVAHVLPLVDLTAFTLPELRAAEDALEHATRADDGVAPSMIQESVLEALTAALRSSANSTVETRSEASVLRYTIDALIITS